MEKYPESQLDLVSRIKAESIHALLKTLMGLRGKRGPLTEAAEFHHRHTDSYYWNESFYFNFTDPEKKIGGFTRIGMLPNQNTAIGILYLYLADGSINMLVQAEPLEASRDEIQTGLLRYERIRPLWEWKITFQGTMIHFENHRMLLDFIDQKYPEDLVFHNASVDLVFKGWAPCVHFKDLNLRAFAERMVAKKIRFGDLKSISTLASEHYQQVGTWSGTIEIEGEKIPFEGSGCRDHSWGDRDWKAPQKTTYLTAQFDNKIGFILGRVVIKTMDVVNGIITRGREHYPLRRLHLETEFEEDGVTQKRVFFRFEDVSGWEMEAEGTPLTVVPLVFEDQGRRTLVNEAFTQYRWGNKTGYGISECLHQL